MTVHPASAPDESAQVVLGFRQGRPVSLDGAEMGIREIVARLSALGGAHGFGRVDMIENRLVGIKSREVYEVPGALALIAAHRDLEDLTLERELAHEKAGLERRWAELCYYGLWFGPLHASLRAFMAASQERVTGEVRLAFYKGSCRVVGRRSDVALYDHGLATYDERADRFDQRLAEGFVSLWSLPLKVWAERGAPDAGRGGSRRASGSQIPLRRGDAELATFRSGAERGAPRLARPSRAPAAPTSDDSPGAPYVWSGRFEQPPAADTTALPQLAPLRPPAPAVRPGRHRRARRRAASRRSARRGRRATARLGDRCAAARGGRRDVPLLPRRRGRARRGRTRPDRAAGRPGRAGPRGPQPQRPGRHRPAPVDQGRRGGARPPRRAR